MKDTNYATEKEQSGYSKLIDFNSYLNLKELTQTNKGDYRDASGITTTQQKINIENKIRNQTLLFDDDGYPIITGTARQTQHEYSANTLYIEAHKVADLMLDYITIDFIPLYVNYLNNDTIVVFNLAKLKHRPTKKHMRIFSKLYNSFEIADREELELQDAFIYKKDDDNKYRLIYKP